MTCQEQEPKHKGSGKQQFRIFSFKAEACSHAFRCLEYQIPKKQGPPHGDYDVQNVVCDRGHLSEIIQVHLKYVQQGICYILHDLQAKAIDPLDKALKNSFKDGSHLPI